LAVHPQLLTGQKLFCRCPAGRFQKPDDYDAEIVRHMRPTLSELGEYDGTALMEFKTRKNIIYRIKSPTACTYEVDDTPPFPLNRQALEIAIEIALLSTSPASSTWTAASPPGSSAPPSSGWRARSR
jgi:glutamyl-tRNA(Gln) amidotransferase subunit E